jgi:hypothetical protein
LARILFHDRFLFCINMFENHIDTKIKYVVEIGVVIND